MEKRPVPEEANRAEPVRTPEAANIGIVACFAALRVGP